jgi:UDP-N-acetylglucosamine 2-epimerase (hydrolysing)
MHPVTTELNLLDNQLNILIDTLKETNRNYVVIYPNNDLGSSLIIDKYNQELAKNLKFKISHVRIS